MRINVCIKRVIRAAEPLFRLPLRTRESAKTPSPPNVCLARSGRSPSVLGGRRKGTEPVGSSTARSFPCVVMQCSKSGRRDQGCYQRANEKERGFRMVEPIEDDLTRKFRWLARALTPGRGALGLSGSPPCRLDTEGTSAWGFASRARGISRDLGETSFLLPTHSRDCESSPTDRAAAVYFSPFLHTQIAPPPSTLRLSNFRHLTKNTRRVWKSLSAAWSGARMARAPR